ncbi:DUF485 domain-containing protein [Metabacillus rhizolycopersici]|uniref:DUF485 domain-containing protein n=1 Tax=Metabacillus rhizolycopersici TaxID=2875709 RepID=A0ABS7UX51_9BACI|nr:DUF485 domain-containing protein [Metabacillus rhizolycopersici]MBZ5752901.1 DUF485 domain-containing protein [Metabacillus rhizolycopersici]
MNQSSENVIYEEKDQHVNYDRIAKTEEFKQLVSEKKRFILPYSVFYLSYSLLLPFLTFYTDILNHQVIGDITWAWIYGLSFIPVSLWVCSFYVKKAAYFDGKAKEILEKEGL